MPQPSLDTAPIRKMERNDLVAVVDVHLQSFDGFFLTFLGRNFLYELYKSILNDPAGIGLVSVEAGKVVGFVMGTSQPSGFYRRLIGKRWWRFGLASIPAILRKPSILPRLVRAFAKPAETVQEDGCGELMSLAVLPACRRGGVGQALVDAFLQEAAWRGLRAISLTTDRLHNEGVNTFYRNLGFTSVRSFATPEGREMIEYRIGLEWT